MCMYTHAYIYTYTHICLCTYTHTHIYIYMYTYIYRYIYIDIYMNIDIQTWMKMYKYRCHLSHTICPLRLFTTITHFPPAIRMSRIEFSTKSFGSFRSTTPDFSISGFTSRNTKSWVVRTRTITSFCCTPSHSASEPEATSVIQRGCVKRTPCVWNT